MKPKFRVWDIEEKKIKAVSRINFDDGEVVSVGIVPEGKYAINEYPIDDFELMQSTGLKDKNGTEIYAGDIVKVNKTLANKRLIGVVKYCGSAFKVKGVKQYLHSLEELNSNYEVVGNIYQHSHLLEDDNHAK